MTLIESLLDAIVRLEGDALVMHVGEKPYVVTTSAAMSPYRGPLAWGQVELSSRVLTLDAVLGMLGQLLPLERRQTLDDLGAIEHEIAPPPGSSEQFTVVAARGGDDVWLELRRKVKAKEKEAEEAPFEIVPEVQQTSPTDAEVNALLEASAAALVSTGAPPVDDDERQVLNAVAAPISEPVSAVAPEREAAAEPEPAVAAAEESEPESLTAIAFEPAPVASVEAAEPAAVVEAERLAPGIEPQHQHVQVAAEPQVLRVESVTFISEPEPEHVDVVASEPAHVSAVAPEPEPVVAETSAPEPVTESAVTPPAESPRPPIAIVTPSENEDQDRDQRAVVVPIVRTPVRSDVASTAAAASAQGFTVEELLRVAAARGASTVYVVAQSQPMVRADGEINPLDIGSGAPLAEADVNRLVLDLAPPATRDLWQRGGSAEWMCDVAGVGRVRCLTFRDHRGTGLIFRMIPPRAISTDQLGLTPAVQALCSQSDGLVLVTGPRASGKSTLMSAFVDLINRTRSDHVVTIESQIGFVHESRRSFVSQREVVGNAEAVVSAMRAALREDPDVLLIDDLRSAEIAAVALEVAESGRLVFGSLPAASTVAAIDRLLELFPADKRSQARSSLAGALRGVVAQVLLRRARGGRVAAREVLLNTAPVAALIEEGKIVQLPLAIESGRRHGMMTLNDTLAGFVRDGTVSVTEAYVKAFDKDGLLTALKRDGVDTSFAERLA